MSRLFVLRAVGCYETVRNSRMEQQINLKFLVKLKKTPTECFKLLKEVYGEGVMSRTKIFEWHKRFEKGRKDDVFIGQMKTSLELSSWCKVIAG